jgi:hypothetical protein
MTTPNIQKLASYLSTNSGCKIASLVYTKKGVVRGRGANRKSYGRDRVRVTFLSGFDYAAVVRKSQALLPEMKSAAIAEIAKDKGLLDKNGNSLQFPDIQKALVEVWESFARTLEGNGVSTTQDVYETLEVNGQKVHGCRVYIGEGSPEDPRAPIPGTIYIQGLFVGKTVLEEDVYGPAPEPKSGAVPLAKRLIRQQLPVGRYVSFALEPGSDFDLQVGGSAGFSLQDGEITLHDDELDKLLEQIS